MKNEMLRNPTKYIKIIFCSNKKQKVEKKIYYVVSSYEESKRVLI